LKINASTGAISGTVAVGAAGNGPYFVTVVAEDGTYRASQTFNWNITSPVSIVVPVRSNQQRRRCDFAVHRRQRFQQRHVALRRAGPAARAPGHQRDLGRDQAATITAGAAANGPYTVTLGAGDGTYSSTVTFTWNVNSR